MENKKVLTTELSAEQLIEVISILKSSFPQEMEMIYRSDFELEDKHSVEDELKSIKNLGLTVNQEGMYTLETMGMSKCTKSIVQVVVDVIFFVLGLAGLHASAQEKKVGEAILRKLTPSKLEKLLKLIIRIEKQHSAVKKAHAIWDIFKFIYDIGVFSIAVAVLKKHMSTWQWIKTGSLAVLQVVAWVASGGVAFVAEAALCASDMEGIVEDSVEACKNCKA